MKSYKKVISIIIIFTFCLMSNSLVVATSAKNSSGLLKNGSFESGVNDWSIWTQSSDCSVKESTKESIDGAKSLEFCGKNSSSKAIVSQKIDRSTVVNNSIKVDQWIKSSNFNGKLQVRARYANADGENISTDIKDMFISNKNKWELKEFNFNINQDNNVKSIYIDYILVGKGSMYIDNVNAVSENISEDSILENKGFEEDFSYWGIWSEDKSKLKISIDDECRIEGRKSLKLSNDTISASRGLVSQRVEVKDHLSETMELSSNIKTKEFNGSIQVRIKFLDSTQNNVISTDTKTIAIDSNSDWTNKLFKVEIPDNKEIFYAEIDFVYEGGIGSVWLDNINIAFNKSTWSNNLIKNEGFEEDFSYWQPRKSKGDFAAYIDNSIKKDCTKSLHMTGNNSATGRVYQIIKVDNEIKGKVINLNQWIKSNNLSGYGIQMRVRFLDDISEDANEVASRQLYLLGIDKTEDWKEEKFNIFVPDDVNVSAIEIEYIYNNCSGDFWIDNIQANEDNSDLSKNLNENILLNNSFETTTNNEVSAWDIHDCSESFDSSNAHSGKNSLKLVSNEELSSPNITQYVDVTDNILGSSIKISEYMKSNSANNVLITLKFLDDDYNEVVKPNEISHTISNDSKWNMYSDIIELPESSKITKLALEYKIKNMVGAIWIDDAGLQPFKKLKEVSSNSQIEQLNIGEKKKCDFSLLPSDASHNFLNLSSENESIVKINNNNELEAIAPGITNIRVEQQFQNSYWEIPVIVKGKNEVNIEPIVNITVNQNNIEKGIVKTKLSGKKLKYSILTQGSHGYADISEEGSFKYFPNKDYKGKDSFTVEVENEQGKNSLIQYNVNIEKGKFTLDNKNIMLTITQDEECKGRLNIKCSDNVKLSVYKDAEHGKFTISDDGEYEYIANNGYLGYEDIELKAVNEDGEVDYLKVYIYISPNTDTINSKLVVKHPNSLIGQERFEEIKGLITSDENEKKWFNTIKGKADDMLDSEVVPYTINVSELDTSSVEKIETLSFMFKITGDKNYAERAWKEIKNVCNYRDWHDSKFLDTAQLSVATAIGYDWLYEYLSQEQREIIKRNILNKSLNKYLNEDWLDQNTNNWSIVCNSSMIFAALTIAGDSDSDIPEKIVIKALKSMQNSLYMYYSDGSSVEGPNYWQFSTEYLMYSSTILENVLGIKSPFDSIVDFDKLSQYPIYIDGVNGMYNYADSYNNECINSYISLWLAKKTNNHELGKASMMAQKKNKAVSIFDLIWYDKDLYCDSVSSNLDKLFDENQILTMRSDFIKDYSTFAAIKGGDTSVSHGDLDIGSFVYDALGVRWALDLGCDNYYLPGYWDMEKSGKRWSYYSKQAQGHNTLVVGKSPNEDQVVESVSKIIDTNLNCDNPYTILDMTPAYSNKAINITRKMQLLNNRKDLDIQDEFILKDNEDIAWQMHTAADVNVVDYGRGLILSQDGQKLKMSLSSDCDIKFQVEELNQKVDNLNKNVRKIIAKTNSRKGKIEVKLIPQGDINGIKPIIKNGDFEVEKLDGSGWNIWNQTGNFDVSIDTTNKNTGKSSVKFYSINGKKARGGLCRTIDISDYCNKKISLSQYVRGDNSDGSMFLRYSYLDSKGNVISNKNIINFELGGGWNRVQEILTVPYNAKNILLEYIYDNCSGDIWLDDVEAHTLDCDLNGDGSIDALDLALESENYNRQSTDSGWNSKFDFNRDNIIDIYDIVYLSSIIE